MDQSTSKENNVDLSERNNEAWQSSHPEASLSVIVTLYHSQQAYKSIILHAARCVQAMVSTYEL